MDIFAYDLLVCRLTATTSSSATVATRATRFSFVNQIGSFVTEAGLYYDWLFFMFYSDVGGVGFVLVAQVNTGVNVIADNSSVGSLKKKEIKGVKIIQDKNKDILR